MTPFLKQALTEWLAVHPGGPALFCHAGTVARSKKRSRTTGHQNDKKRPSSQKGRMATVKKRELAAQAALTRNEVHDHFKRVLAGTKWEGMRGFTRYGTALSPRVPVREWISGLCRNGRAT